MAKLNNHTLEVLSADIEKAVAKYQAEYNSHDCEPTVLKTLKKVVDTKVNAWNTAYCDEQYRRWALEGNPVVMAIKNRQVTDLLRVILKADDNDMMVATYKYDVKQFASLPRIQHICGVENFNDPTWFNRLEALAWLLAGHVNKKLNGGKLNLEYHIKEASREFKFDAGVNPTSVDGITEALQQVFDSIITINDAEGNNRLKLVVEVDEDGGKYCPAWQFIRESMTRNSSTTEKSGVSICNTVKCCQYVLEAMNNVFMCNEFALTQDVYESVDYADDKQA